MDYYDLGSYTRKVTTAGPDAQLWFDRGLTWLYGFEGRGLSGRPDRGSSARGSTLTPVLDASRRSAGERRETGV